jgi:hypothetical protein
MILSTCGACRICSTILNSHKAIEIILFLTIFSPKITCTTRFNNEGFFNLSIQCICVGGCQPQGHSAAGRITLMKNSSDTIGNRARNLPVCRVVPQSFAPPLSCPQAYMQWTLNSMSYGISQNLHQC